MMIRDTTAAYGIVTRLVHWLMALAIFALFALGAWMVTLEYDSPYYKSGPDVHRSVGILVGAALLFRVFWRAVNVHPDDGELKPFERIAARIAHWSFYVLIALITVSGYLISSSDGQPVDVFGLFSVPSVVTSQGLSDTAGYIHRVLAYLTMALAGLHAAAAVKHHFVDRSSILTRMWSGSVKTREQSE